MVPWFMIIQYYPIFSNIIQYYPTLSNIIQHYPIFSNILPLYTLFEHHSFPMYFAGRTRHLGAFQTRSTPWMRPNGAAHFKWSERRKKKDQLSYGYMDIYTFRYPVICIKWIKCNLCNVWNVCDVWYVCDV